MTAIAINHNARTILRSLIILLSALVLSSSVQAQPSSSPSTPPKQTQTTQSTSSATTPPPFGANLFLGNFHKQREDGLNPDYVVMTGDKIAVHTWGAIETNQVHVVDGQGNIFLPGIGPVSVGGVRNEDLTKTVQRSIGRIYRSNFGVYTNLLTAAPVAVFVTGAVVHPGRYAGIPSDSVLFFLNQAGGIHPKLGSYRHIEIFRNGTALANFDLYDFLLEGRLPAIQFAEGDTILVRRRGPVVEIGGEVASPARIEFKKQPMTGAEAVHIVPSATRATEVTIRGTRSGKLFKHTVTTSEFRTTELRDGDSVMFRHAGNAETILIHLQGEFLGPSVLAVYRGARLLEVLNYIKVNPTLSDLGSIHIRRKSVARAQKKSIEDSLFRLERSALLALSATSTEASIRAKEAELMKSFVASARQIQPLGRVVTSVRGKPLNLLMEDGDTIVIPAQSNVVQIGGEVQVAQAVVYSPKLRASHYVRLAGGFTQRARRDQVILVHASAAVSIRPSNAIVKPGDMILIPPKVDQKILQNATDITQVIYQIAVAAAVVLAI